MTKGKIKRIIRSFGSQWGRICPDGEVREVFFNVDSLDRRQDFVNLYEGQAVEFEEVADYVNGSHAVAMVISAGAGSYRVSRQQN